MAYTELDSKRIFEKFDKILTAQGWSIYSLSNEANVNCCTIYKWRKTKSMPTLGMLDSVCKILNISVASLLSLGEVPEIDESEKELLDLWSGIDNNAKVALISLMKSLQRSR